MKKSRFTEEKIISTLRESDAGVKVVELCRKGFEAQYARPMYRVRSAIMKGWVLSCRANDVQIREPIFERRILTVAGQMERLIGAYRVATVRK
jgi:hypothetical protein